MEIHEVVQKQRRFFTTGATRSLAARQAALSRLEWAIRRNEKWILNALKADLNKSETEAYMTEVGMVLAELHRVRKHLKEWAAPRQVPSSAAVFPSKSYLIPEPYGVVLIMSPWNYPFALTLHPLIGALAAGNCCVIKPSAYASRTSSIIRKLVAEALPEKYATVITGGRAENTALLEERFDYIFFTGGVKVGRLVMEKAAAHLTPVTLELGGKSPCIVEESADLNLAAKRIVFGKFLNAGQTCVAPDYVLADRRIKDELLFYLRKWIRKLYGQEPLKNPHYPKIINEEHFNRLIHLLRDERIALGGGINPDTRQIEPTVIDFVTEESPLMQEEIFGPLLPILSYDSLAEAEKLILRREKPLAAYIFTANPKAARRLVKRLSFGGGCINDTVLHLASKGLPFGGVGQSGMGHYHGCFSFDTFSHQKGLLKSPVHLDIPLRYPPYGILKKHLIHFLIR